jgi:TetR/AcrR family transcriptional regulator, cholesterol catabolism regulator
MRERIADTARFLFQRHGVKGVTLDDIAAEVSISKRTIYEYFQNKEEIADEVMSSILKESIETIKSIRKNEEDPLVQLIEIVKWIEETISATNSLFLEEVRKYFFKSYIRFQNQLNAKLLRPFADIIEEGKKKELIREEVNSDLIARYCIQMLRNTIRSMDFQEDSTIFESVCNYFISGIISQKGKRIFKTRISFC